MRGKTLRSGAKLKDSQFMKKQVPGLFTIGWIIEQLERKTTIQTGSYRAL